MNRFCTGTVGIEGHTGRVEHRRRLTSDHPVSVALTLGPLRRGPGDPTVVRDGSRLWLTTRMPSGPATVLLEQAGPRMVDARAWGPGAQERLESLHCMLGTDRPAPSFRAAHPHIADAERRYPGLRVPATGRLLESLLPAVLEQKVLGVDAFASWRRLVHALGEPAPGPAPERMRVFPTAEQWAAVPSWDWHEAGVDPKRYRTAQACARVGPQLERVAAEQDTEATLRALRSVPGVGVWTVAETAGRALGDDDAVPFGDYHLGHLVGIGLLGRRIDVDDHETIATALEPYRPYRLLAVRLLQLSPYVRLERRGPRLARVDHRRI
ncbi:DNA-3-methyladenine glycosylase family protein [Aeromicrobium sp. CF4.19]|uniref:DNA-3-methyladenine glycosylase family protein n=1 Tax=Aeromicrobium sp. CF4.19 TaxID=3373082 RepID=UPI003EE51CF1